jgi:hypothetical protein
MAKIFDSGFDTSSAYGEFFWHATTIENIFKMIEFNAGGLKPVGTGQLGNGFYLTGTRSDYQKAMARRNRKESTQEVPLFLLYVYVQDFYRLKPKFLDSWNIESGGADFSAVCWYEHGTGGIDQPERGTFMPSARDGSKTAFKYGQYQGESIANRALAQQPASQKIAFLEMLWSYAEKGTRPLYQDVADSPYALMLSTIGPKMLFKRSLLELALKSQSALANSAVVGAKLFSPTTQPLKLAFEYNNKNYDLREAIVEIDSVRQDENPLNFHEEVWVDLDKLTSILGA